MTELPSTSEREAYLNRARKLVRAPLAHYYEAGDIMKQFLLREAGVQRINQIPKARWESLLTELEALKDPNDVYQLLVFGR